MPHKLGQVFLKNRKKIKKIVDQLKLKEKETLIEIGPGYGNLTQEILKRNKNLKLILIEKDKKFIPYLNKINVFNNRIEIINDDALKILKDENFLKQNKEYKLVGNLPYYLTGKILRVLSETKNKPKLIVFTIQKEVALRICAQPPRMNLLAAILQFWAKPEIIDFISKKNFSPKPKVDSAILKITPLNLKYDNFFIENYYKFVRILFKQPRKTIFNNLKIIIKNQEDFLHLKNARAQNLNIKNIIKLFKKCYNL